FALVELKSSARLAAHGNELPPLPDPGCDVGSQEAPEPSDLEGWKLSALCQGPHRPNLDAKEFSNFIGAKDIALRNRLRCRYSAVARVSAGGRDRHSPAVYQSARTFSIVPPSQRASFLKTA